MSRFVPALRELWLALKRAGIIKDVRQLILYYARKRMFDWESEECRLDRQSFGWYVHPIFHREFMRFLRRSVEPCDPLPFPNDEPFELALQRVNVKQNWAPNLRPMWIWLERMAPNPRRPHENSPEDDAEESEEDG